jgi:non-ribosomal peptide synthetase-like protein
MAVGPGLMARSQHAPPERTLLDILDETAARHPLAPAIDDGRTTLTYARLAAAVEASRARLVAAGVGPGDRVGIRLRSGTAELYTSILGVLAAGAAYVPVDLDDPQERADLVFGEAAVVAVLGADTGLQLRRTERTMPASRRPEPDDDAWIIFTSGSTGTPKGVAVTHRSAAAFVDAEARMFLAAAPLGPGDRVLAGLSVAFDASCEEMWLAWRHGACLVPAPRALVRTGMDLGPWLVAQQVTAVSTVPTLASLWQPAELAAVRLLIFGGEACPPELAERLATGDREVWNTYGPTEATVVACGARLTGIGPVRIGLPLDGWDLAVVDGQGLPVADGETGELIIGGVGLARYLDPAKDAEKFAPMPTLGWQRAYRSGDLVRFEPEGLVFAGRADDQVKLGGRRIELGEVDAALQALPGVGGAAAAVRGTAGGHQVLVGYLAPVPGAADDPDEPELDLAALTGRLRGSLPAALVPRLVLVDTIPTRTSGKVDRDALPWPVGDAGQEGADGAGVPDGLTGTQGWLAGVWTDVLGARVTGPRDDFFALGGGSLAAALMVSRLRARFPETTVADVYENPTLAALADTLDEYAPAVAAAGRTIVPVPRRAQLVQAVLGLPLAALEGLRWLVWLALVNDLAAAWTGAPWTRPVSWWWVAAGWLLLVTPAGRMGMTALVARVLLRGVRPGAYRRGGSVHLRLWFTEAFAAAAGAENLAGAPWMTYYARALGAKVDRGVHLHAIPPVTGLLTLGQGCAVEPEVDLTGHWLDGDVLHLGRIRVGARASVGARSTLAPGSRIGQDAEVAPGSFVTGSVPPDELWAGSPAVFAGIADRDWPARRPPRARGWVLGYGLTAMLLGAVPLLAVAPGLALLGRAARDTDLAGLPRVLALWTAPAALLGFVVLAALVAVLVRLLGIGLREGHHAVRSRVGWQAWSTERLMDDARTWLFPLYASLFTPTWLRLLGAQIGRGVEASTVLMLPRMTKVGDHAFLADDTMIGSYELRGGWLRIERAKVGKRAFLGNSGMTAPGRRLPKDSLVAVLSAAPQRAKAGTSWLGSPPVQMRRSAQDVDQSRTFDPPGRLKVARALVELARGLPVVCTAGLGVAVLLALQQVADRAGWWAAVLLAGPVLLVAGVVAATVATLAKWLLVGRIAVQERPLWSSFVWRNELADTFVELLAVPWFVRTVPGTAMLNLWLRSLGASIGRGVWCESHWLPEADLVRLGDGVTVNRGCVLQTHLFHDRIMSIDGVSLEEGSTIGPHGVILPAASIGTGSTVGPASLVMRGESVPAHSRWTGNPISAWTG